tara:strand:+ start:1135 stop:1437 length:303 start_codon:yes stop_codon:yes gene_type:complete
MSDMKTLLENFSRFTGGQIDIQPLSDEEQEDSADAYYELFHFLMDSRLPGSKPSDKLQYALRWIAKFEQHGGDGAVGQIEDDEGEYHHGPIDDRAPEEMQ